MRPAARRRIPSLSGTHILRDAGAGDRKVRIMWTKQVADFVLMLGMELADA
jgi:hypothetical protein